jgi:hypothetical protein
VFVVIPLALILAEAVIEFTYNTFHDLAVLPNVNDGEPLTGTILLLAVIVPPDGEIISLVATPSTYISSHVFEGEPKSYVDETLGIILELMSAPKATESVLASPKFMVPETNNDPETLTVSPELGVIVFTYNVLICVCVY